MKAFLTTSLFVGLSLHSTVTEQLIPVSYYGWLDQYSMDSRHNFVGDEACVPTSSTNALTFQQNINPQIFGSTLSGVTYADWENTDDYLIAVMGTTVGNGTYYYQFVPALNTYVTQTKGFPEVQFSGMFPSDNWAPALGYPQPSYITSGLPTVAFLSNALAAGSSVLISISYTNGNGGHELLVNGLNWDSVAQKGTLYFVDPLDPSQNYSPEVPLGPVKQTSGTLTQNGDELILEYNQYEGRLPYDGLYSDAKASLYGVLAFSGAMIVPYSDLLLSGNNHQIALGFNGLDPTTAAINPVLAILNTSTLSGLNSAFAQFDPSPFNAILFSEENVAEQVQSLIRNNLWQYRHPCFCSCDDNFIRLWGAPFETHITQCGASGSIANSGYRNHVRGAVFGAEIFPWDNILLGGAYANSRTRISWHSAPESACLKSYEGVLYGAWTCSPLWIDASFAYAYNEIQACRTISLTSPNSFVPGLQSTLTHKNHSDLYGAHLGVIYDWLSLPICQMDTLLWPFFNLDYFNVNQPSYSEIGGGILNLTVNQKETNYLRPEIGLGCSLWKDHGDCFTFIHATVSYARECRFDGKHTGAYFSGTPASAFTVSGLFPQNDLFCPTVQVGLMSPSDTYRLHFNYNGAFGSKFTSNEIAAELAIAF